MVEVKHGDGSVTHKFMQSLGDQSYDALVKAALDRGLESVQELLRAVVIPDWLNQNRKNERYAAETNAAREAAFRR